MDIELIEIRDFLKQHHPFDLLPDEALEGLPKSIEVRYARRGTVLFEPGEENKFLWVVRTGAIETRDPENNLLARLSEGECFGVRAIMRGVAVNRCEAIEDSLLYLLPVDDFNRLRDNFQQFAFFFAPLGGERLRSARALDKSGSADDLGLITTKVRDLLRRQGPVVCKPTVSIQEAATVMSNEKVSCILVTEDDKIVGIATDKDLRNRVVAKGYDISRPLFEIMTKDPVCIDAESYLFDAMLLMSQKNIRHLPVLDGGQAAGVITNTNIVQKQSTSMVFLVGDVYKRQSIEGLKEVVKQVPNMVMNLVSGGATAHNVGHVVSTVTDAIARRLLQMAEEKLGAPPVPYAWIVVGSEARHEQTALSDQDNGIILDDSYDEAKHGDYFKELAKFVCDGLNECGYIYCPGDVMATNDKWRQPLSQWKKYFSKWIDTPEPEALMLSSVFFDMRALHGDESLYENLRKYVVEKSSGNRIFLSFMAGNALTHQPPLGFFKNFVLIRGGDHNHTFDLKHTGVVPIIDLARTYSLDAGLFEINTQDRLKAAVEKKVISQAGANDLLDALEFISITRLRHQARQIRRREKVDNFMPPDDMSHFERNHLKDAFNVVKTMQAALASAYT
ncbi:MAG: cyclic nucleotide-binding/CBS domain-containing protein [Methylocystaceae bacterium]|nr:cyclic nucleotide-binding/CBS domain-containing protein [Methylocystaceae bacterium]